VGKSGVIEAPIRLTAGASEPSRDCPARSHAPDTDAFDIDFSRRSRKSARSCQHLRLTDIF